MGESKKGQITYEVKIDDSNIEADLNRVNSKIEEAARKTADKIIEYAKETKREIEEQSNEIVKETAKTAEQTTKETIDGLKETCNSVEKSLSEIKNTTIKINIDTEDAEKELDDLVQSAKEVGKQVFSASDKGEKSSITEKAGKVVTSSVKAIGSAGKNIGEIGLKSVAGTATAVVEIGKQAVEMADDMQGAVNKYISETGKGKEETEQYQQVLENLYLGNYGESFSDIADSMAEVNHSMGEMDVSNLQSVTESAFVLRDTFGIDISESTKTAKALMDEYGLSSEEAMNTIAAGAQNGLTSSEELFAAMENGFSATGDEMDSIKEIQGDSLGGMFEELTRQLDLFIVPLGEALIPILELLIESVLPILQEALTPLIDALVILLEPIMELVELALPPLIDAFMFLVDEGILPLAKTIEEKLVPIFEKHMPEIEEKVKKVIGNIKNIFGELIDFVKNVFAGNWKGVLENVKNIFSNVLEGLGTIFKTPINTMIDAINTFIGGVNKIKIPEFVPIIGGKGFKIPKIPRLKVGLDYVPSDYFPAFLDEGEAVLTKEENALFRSLGGLEGMIQFANSQYPDIFRLQTEATPIIIHSHVDLDGKEVGNSVTKYVDNNFSINESLRRRGN